MWSLADQMGEVLVVDAHEHIVAAGSLIRNEA